MEKQTIIHFQFPKDDRNIRLVQGVNVNHTFARHVHHSFSLGVVQKGQRSIEVEGTSYTISAGEGFIIHPHQPHSLGGGEHDYYVLSIAAHVMQKIYRDGLGEDRLPHFSQVKITDIFILNGLTAWLEKNALGEWTDEEELLVVLKEFVIRHAHRTAPEQARRGNHATVELACAYIEANLEQTIRLDAIARLTHVSPFYLNRIFRQEIGVPPYTYLLQARIKKSLDVLLQTASVSEAAYELGFADQSHFTRFFKKNVGITPQRFLDLHAAKTRCHNGRQRTCSDGMDGVV